jgi:hypothetical protein
MTDQELKDIVASLAVSQQETGKQVRATAEQMKKTDEQMKRNEEKLSRMGYRLGSIGNSQGEIAEEYFFNSIKEDLKLGGVQYDDLYPNMGRVNKKGLEGEYDMVLINGTEIAIVEIKYNAKLEDIARFITRQYPTFKKLYPEYKNYKHNLGFASFHISDDVKQKALDNNIMILQRKGDIIETTLPSMVNNE